VIKGCILFGVKNWQTLAALGGGALSYNKKSSRVQNAAGRTRGSGGDPLLLYNILHVLFFPLVQIRCALRLESRKNYQHGLDAGPLEFQFLRPKGCLTNPFRTRLLCFGVIGNTPGLICRNNFVKKNLSALAIAIKSWQDVTLSSICSGVKECGTKHAHKFLFPKSSFRIRRTTVLGKFEDFAIILDAIRLSFLKNQQQEQYLPSKLESILDGHLSRRILPAPFRLEIENSN
jgi:hypothetical protein